MLTIEQLCQSPNILAADYSHSYIANEILLAGHIHQASPDCSLKGQEEAWRCTASQGEERWDCVFEKAGQVRAGYAELIHGRAENITLASSVHDLVIRFISSLPLHKRPRIVTTDGEHPSVLRQLIRLSEVGVQLEVVPVHPSATIVQRVEEQINDQTAAVCISSVFFETGHVALEMDTLLPVCQQHGVELFVDAYQSVNVLSFSIEEYNLGQAFVVGGGSKYCQLGDGICFMHVPYDCRLRPLITGWYGCFDSVLDNPAAQPISYGDGHSLFDGSSVDPTAHFRACHVFEYFREKGLSPEFLHDVNHHQLRLISSHFKSFDFDPEIIELTNEVEFLGGFISFSSPYLISYQPQSPLPIVLYMHTV